ncbi:hypothetical protein JCM5350_001423 [Sporobolomyces pararoseus]
MGVHPSRLPPDAPPSLIELDSALHIAKMTAVSALSIAVYDWIVCLDEEIKYISLLSVDYVLALRVVGIYCFQRYVTACIVVLISIQTALALWSSNYHMVVGIPPVIPGCFIRPGLGPRLGVSLYWFPAAVNNLVLLILTVVRIFPIWSNATEARWTWILLRDQIFVSFAHLLNVLKQNTLASVMVPLALTLPPVLVFHLVLNLRSIAQSPASSEHEFDAIPMKELLATESVIKRSRGTSETSGQTRRRILSRSREHEETDFETGGETFNRESGTEDIQRPAVAHSTVF